MNKVAEYASAVVMLFSYIWEMFGLNLGQNTIKPYWGFS
jgi:hypothetical protein